MLLMVVLVGLITELNLFFSYRLPADDGKSDAATMEIVEAEATVHIESMTFEQENCKWSVLPAPTMPTVPLSNKRFQYTKKDPMHLPNSEYLSWLWRFHHEFCGIHD
jgi:hypothetical protein